MSADPVLDRFRHDLAAVDVDPSTQRVLVACSGGADSTALVGLLAEVASEPESDWRIGHVNHGLRGAESDGDEAFVRALGARFGREVVVERVDVRAELAIGGQGLEDAARRTRYRVFREWARRFDLDAVLLAHHREDQQETVLLRVCRGAGVRGLAGMPVTRALDAVSERSTIVARPLLSWSRDELEAVLEARGVPWRLDASNDSSAHARNRVRRQVLPLLEAAVHPGARDALERLARHARDLERDLGSLGRRAYEEARRPSVASGCVVLSLPVVCSWPPSVRRELFETAWQALRGRAGGLSAAACRSVEELCAPTSTTRCVDLPGEVRVRRLGARGELAWLDLRVDPGGVDDGSATPVEVDGPPVSWSGWTLRAERLAGLPEAYAPGEEWIDARALEGALVVRARRLGDTYRPLGAPGGRKVAEVLRERGVPVEARGRVPVISAGDRIVWVVGAPIDERCRVRADTVEVVRLVARLS